MLSQNGAVADSGPAATLINRPLVSLTERGHRLLALLRCRELLPISSTVVAAAIDVRIGELLEDIGCD